MSGATSATSTLEAPMSMAASTPMLLESSNISGRRPPEDGWDPVSSSKPRSISAATSVFALLRENPVCCASSVRDRPGDQKTASSTMISAEERSCQQSIAHHSR